jgi:SAM-dependent methyltransferase
MTGSDARAALLPLERALLRHHAGSPDEIVDVLVDDGTSHGLPVALFFRGAADRLEVDGAALALCRGRVLDVGACAGALSLPLQAAGHEVTALELLPGAVEVMRARGVRDAREGDLWTFQPERAFDTVLALMNGTAAAGTMAGLIPLLAALAGLLAPGGQLLIDSTDLRGRGGRGTARRRDGRYVGELQYQLEYGGERGPPFPQLFVDAERLAEAGVAVGLDTEVVWQGRRPPGAYLARLTRR